VQQESAGEVTGEATGDMTRYAPGERLLLRAVRDLVAADDEMRRATGRRMELGSSDLRATRFVMTACTAGAIVTPRDIARHLGLTTAATTTVLDRLVAAGHVERRPHPTDGRSKIVVVTDHARTQAHQALSSVHDEMRAAAAAVPPESREAVLGFLERMAAAMRRQASEQVAAPER
jgi:DNA-binding MarR family transcriptional regulator